MPRKKMTPKEREIEIKRLGKKMKRGGKATEQDIDRYLALVRSGEKRTNSSDLFEKTRELPISLVGSCGKKKRSKIVDPHDYAGN